MVNNAFSNPLLHIIVSPPTLSFLLPHSVFSSYSNSQFLILFSSIFISVCLSPSPFLSPHVCYFSIRFKLFLPQHLQRNFRCGNLISDSFPLLSVSSYLPLPPQPSVVTSLTDSRDSDDLKTLEILQFRPRYAGFCL